MCDRSTLNKSCSSHLGTVIHCLTGHVYSSSDIHNVRLSHVHYNDDACHRWPAFVRSLKSPPSTPVVRFSYIHHSGHKPDIATCPLCVVSPAWDNTAVARVPCPGAVLVRRRVAVLSQCSPKRQIYIELLYELRWYRFVSRGSHESRSHLSHAGRCFSRANKTAVLAAGLMSAVVER